MKNIMAGLVLVVMGFSCTVVEGIFKAGVWVGIMSVVIIVGLLLYLFYKLRKK